MFIRLTEKIAVAPQIGPEDCAAAAAAGFTTVVNNRPDGEAPGQPDGADIAAAAAATGLAYHAIPIGHGGMSMADVEAMAAVLAASPGPVLAYCRSGTRSTHLWALAAASQGAEPRELTAAAAAGGYDISMLMPTLASLKPRAG